jgi:hypothetical protein
MTVYAIPENELEFLGVMSIKSTIFFSTFSFFISLAVSVVLSGIDADNINKNQIDGLLFYYEAPVTLIIALIFLILGIYKQWKRKNMIKIIKSESIINLE